MFDFTKINKRGSTRLPVDVQTPDGILMYLYGCRFIVLYDMLSLVVFIVSTETV
jgi:hypothetical protein